MPVVQIKWADGLLDYPDGKSGMLWYGVIAPWSGDDLTMLIERLEPIPPTPNLVWRWCEVEEPTLLCVQLLARFERRFGRAPFGMTLEP